MLRSSVVPPSSETVFRGASARLMRWGCAFVAVVAATALAGKALNEPLLASAFSGSIPMAPWTACAFLLVSAALHPDAPWSRSRRICLGLIFLGTLAAASSLALFDARAFFAAPAAVPDARALDPWAHPWTVSPLTALHFFILALACALGLRKEAGRASPAAAWGATLVFVHSGVVLVSYTYRAPLFYGSSIIPMAATTAACFVLLSALLLAEFGRGLWPWNLFEGDTPRALVARSFLPTIVVGVVFVGFLDSRIDLSSNPQFYAFIAIAAAVIMTWLGTKLSLRLGAKLERAEERLGLSEARTEMILRTAMDGFWMMDGEGRILSVNDSYCRMSGYSREELLTMELSQLEASESPEDMAEHLRRIVEAGEQIFESRHRRKNGATYPLEICVQHHRDADGGRFVAFFHDITERRRAEADLQLLRMAIDQAEESIFITDSDGTIVFVNPAFEASTGYGRQEMLGKNPRILNSGKQDEAFYRELWGTISSGRAWKGRMVNKHKDGSLHVADSIISPVRDAGGRIVNYVAAKRDVTENLRLEGELRQAQKMESVGRLAGGVAHDFNNILTAIMGYSEAVIAGLPESDPKRGDIKEIMLASERAARLTRQLLAFSRRQMLDPHVLDINAEVGAMVNMLQRVIGENIKLETRLAPYACRLKADAGQVEQVFLNLAVNARDAMPEGGTLKFETEVLAPSDPACARLQGFSPGRWVRLTISDTGSGMSPEVQAHLFEPFFTTKDKGRGTGLGLSTIYGIVKQSGGDIDVESAPDRGTTFRIYFPQSAEPVWRPRVDGSRGGLPAPRRAETILFVDDEESLQRLVSRALAADGYRVLVAGNGESALKELERHGPVDLLITDVVMPGMSGRELAAAVGSRNLARKTIFISGYTDAAIVDHGVLDPGVVFLYKPFSCGVLQRKAREVLDDCAAPSGVPSVPGGG